jgi:hypothetical protein
MSQNGVSKHDQILVGLVWSLQAAALQQLGKIKNPLTDAVERDLTGARGSIDILEMLKAKCRQDTPPQVLRLLDTTVMELQMNYLDELKKEQQEKKEGAEGGPPAPDGGGAATAADGGSETKNDDSGTGDAK